MTIIADRADVGQSLAAKPFIGLVVELHGVVPRSLADEAVVAQIALEIAGLDGFPSITADVCMVASTIDWLR